MFNQVSPADYKRTIIQRIRLIDVELSEDLYRRLPEHLDIGGLNGFFHHMLAQYDDTTLDIRASLNNTDPFEVWYASFSATILPFLMQHRLPPCTDSKAQSQYLCQSKSI